MIKKILLGIIISLLIILAIIGAYLFSNLVNRPAESLEVKSSVPLDEFTLQGRKADLWLRDLYLGNKLPSMSAAVGINGKLVWVGAIGHADVEKKLLADKDTVYRVGSISKSITASAIMRLQEKGIMDIDNPFDHYVKAFSPSNNYTIKHLLTHQSGIRHYSKGLLGSYNFKDYATARAAAAIVEHDPLLFSPGAGFTYSSYAYNLLALAMESASSTPFENIIFAEVLSPLGMEFTHLEKANQPKDKHAAVAYTLFNDHLLKSLEVNLSDRYAGGGYVSTPSDLVKFGSALLGNEFLNEASINALWAPVPLENGSMNPQNYALGFRVDKDELGKYIHHGGLSAGGYSFFMMCPDSGIVIALASNVSPITPVFDRLVEAKKLANIFISLKN